MTELLDARGVPIAPGDTAIYGFSVSRSVAMAEAVVLGAHGPGSYDVPGEGEKVSLTPSGRVRIRVIRRSYSSGEKPVVDVAPDRLVVLKEVDGPLQPTAPDPCFALPPSPLPTQDEKARAAIEAEMARSTEALRATEAPEWWRGDNRDLALAEYHAFHAAKLKEDRRKLKALDE